METQQMMELLLAKVEKIQTNTETDQEERKAD
jgi:hypothetical protein